MFISFRATPAERVALGSLTFSLRNDVLSDASISSIAKPVAVCQGYFQGHCPGFAKSSVFGTIVLGAHWVSPCGFEVELARFASIDWSWCCGMRSRY